VDELKLARSAASEGDNTGTADIDNVFLFGSELFEIVGSPTRKIKKF